MHRARRVSRDPLLGGRGFHYFKAIFSLVALIACLTPAALASSKPGAQKGNAKGSATSSSAKFNAELPSGPEWATFDVHPGDQLQIEGLRGEVSLSFVDAGPRVAIRVKQNNLLQNEQMIVREGRIIAVRTPTQLSSPDWEQVVAGQIAPVAYQVEVVGGAVGTAITWREGNVKVSGAKLPMTISGTKGQLTLSDILANVRAQWLDGAIQVTQYKGNLNLSTVSASLQVDDYDGSLQLENHLGKTKLKSIQGDLKWVSFKGNLQAEDIKAGTDIEAGQASLNLKNMTGHVRGQNEEGDTVIQLGPQANLRFDSDRGDIRVRLPRGAGAKLSLVTEGRLIAPPSIRIGVDGRNRTAAGRVEGSGPSNVVIHSKTGQISVGM